MKPGSLAGIGLLACSCCSCDPWSRPTRPTRPPGTASLVPQAATAGPLVPAVPAATAEAEGRSSSSNRAAARFSSAASRTKPAKVRQSPLSLCPPLTAVLPLCGCHRVAVRSGSSGGDVSCGKSHNVVCGPMFDFAWKVVYAEQFKLDVTRESNFRALDEQFDLMLDRCTRKCQWEAVLGKAGTDGRCDRRCRQRVAHSSRPQQLTTRQQNMYGASSVHIVEL